nr:phage late control D family protein [Luteibacter rhizovicinus]
MAVSAQAETGAFRLLLNRQPLPLSMQAAISSVEVSNEINVPGMFNFTFSMLSQLGNWQGADLDLFKPGDQVGVQMGLGQPRTVLTGQIYAIEPNFAEYSAATVSGFDAMAKLRFGNHSEIYSGIDENRIARKVADAARVDLSTPGPPVMLNETVWQRQQNNYHFLLGRCALINHELVVDGTTVVFRPSAEGLSPVKSLAFPRDIRRVDLRLRVPTEGSTVQVLSFDPATNKPISARSNPNTVRARMGGSESGFDFIGAFPDAAINITDPSLTKVQALQSRADAEYMQNLDRFIEGELELEGDPDLNAGVNVRLTGLSRRFDGIYYVRSSRHHYDDATGYRTTLQLRRTGA